MGGTNIKLHSGSGDDDNDAGKETQVRVVSLQYTIGGVTGPLLKMPANSKKFQWSLERNGALKEQNMTVGIGNNKQEVKAKFEAKRNQTTIEDKRTETTKKETKPGLVLPPTKEYSLSSSSSHQPLNGGRGRIA